MLAAIPTSHRNVFKYICAFLRKLLQHSANNKLDAKNLGMVIDMHKPACSSICTGTTSAAGWRGTVFTHVCLYMRRSVGRITQNVVGGFSLDLEISVDYRPEKSWLNFGRDPEHILNTYRTKYNDSDTRMWANAQRGGRPAEHRWRPLFNAAVWLTPTTRCRVVTLPRRETC